MEANLAIERVYSSCFSKLLGDSLHFSHESHGEISRRILREAATLPTFSIFSSSCLISSRLVFLDDLFTSTWSFNRVFLPRRRRFRWNILSGGPTDKIYKLSFCSFISLSVLPRKDRIICFCRRNRIGLISRRSFEMSFGRDGSEIGLRPR